MLALSELTLSLRSTTNLIQVSLTGALCSRRRLYNINESTLTSSFAHIAILIKLLVKACSRSVTVKYLEKI